MSNQNHSPGSAIGLTVGGVILVLFVAGLLLVIMPFLKGLLWGMLLVLLTWPVYCLLQKKCSLPEPLAALIMTIGIGSFLLLMVVPIVTELGKEAYSVSKQISLSSFAEGQEKKLSMPLLNDVVRLIPLESPLTDFIKVFGKASLDITSRATQLLLESLATIGMMIFSSFFFYRYGRRSLADLKSVLTHFTHMDWERVFSLTHDTIKGVVYGTVATALAQGTVAGVGFYFAGAPVPLLLGFATMFMSFIPFGAPLVYIPTSLYIYFSTENLFNALGCLAWGVLLVSTVDNVLRPLFISQTVKLPLLLIFIGVVGGIFAFGLLGLFIGPVLVALMHGAWRELALRATNQGSLDNHLMEK